MGMSAHQRIRRAMEEKRKAALEQARLEAPVDIEKMLVGDLKEYAKIKGIDITGLTKKDEIRIRIMESINGGEDGGQPKDDAPEGNAPDESVNQPSGSTEQAEENADRQAGGEGAGTDGAV